MRRAAALACAWLACLAASPAAGDAIDGKRLADELAAPEAGRRLRAARELSGLSPAAATPLVGRALDDPDLEVRVAAILVAGQLGLDELAARLIERAASPDARMREAIVTALGALHPASAPDARALDAALERALADAEVGVRLAALHALAERPPRPDRRAAQIDAIATALGDERPDLRRAAAEALERIGDRAALHALAARIDDASPEVRVAVARALGTFGDPRGAAAVLRLLDDPSEDVRAAAVATLGALGAPTAVPKIAPILERPRDPLAGLAAVALGRIAATRGDADPTAATLRVRAGDLLVAATRRGDNRGAALEGLRASGAAAAALLAPLLPAVGPRAADDLTLLAGDLAAGGDDGVCALLLAAARRAADGRFDAALIGARPPSGATRGALVEWLAARLGDPGAAARRGAATALGALGDPRATRALEGLAADPDAGTRRAALTALAALSAAAEPALVAAARGADAELARTALRALARRRDDVARQALLAAVSSSDPATQRTAALGLADDRDAAGVVAPLLAVLKRGPAAAREAAALALHGPLRGRAPPAAVELCLAAAGDDEPGGAGALELLGAMREGAAAERTLALLPRLGRRPIRRARLYAVLGDLLLVARRPPIARAILDGLVDPDAGARAAAAWALGKGAGGDDVVRALSAHLADPSGAVRANALGALGRLGATPSGPALARLAQDREPAVRANALRLGAGAGSAPRDAATTIVARALAAVKDGPPHVGPDYLLVRIADDAASGPRIAAARIGLPDGLVEVAIVDERGIVREEGVPSGALSIELDPALLR